MAILSLRWVAIPVGVLVAAGAAAAAPPEPDVTTLYEEPSHYAAMPVIVRTKDGSVFVPFNVMEIKTIEADGRHPHYGFEESRKAFVRSDDGGKTWRDPQAWDGPLPIKSPIVHVARGSGPGPTATALSGGRVMQVRKFVRADDGTAGFPTRIDKAYDPIADAPLRPIRGDYPHEVAHTWTMRQVPNGDILLGAYYLEHTPRLSPKIGTAHYFRTTPDGEYWEYLGKIDNPGPFHISESDFYFAPDGTWYAFLRTDWGLWPNEEKAADADGYGFSRGGYGYYVYQAESKDQGQTWSKPWRLPIWGHPPFLLPLESGQVMMVYGARREPWTIEAVLSENHARTWDVDRTRTLFRSRAVGIDFGNPVATQMPDGTILCVTYSYASPDSRKFSARGIYAMRFKENIFASADKE